MDVILKKKKIPLKSHGMFVFVLNVLKTSKSDCLTSWVILRVKSTRRIFFWDELQM